MDISSAAERPDFQLLFEAAPGLYLVLSPDFTIVAVSDAYLRATMTRRADILGRNLFEIFPDNPDDDGATGVANLRASLHRALESGRPDAMAVQKYDIRRPESEGGGFEVRYWSPVNTPVPGADGRPRYLIHRVEDVTEFIRLKESEKAQLLVSDELRQRADAMEAEIYRRAQQIQESNQELRALQDDLARRVDLRTADLLRTNGELQREMEEHRRTEAALQRSEAQLRQAQKMEAIGRLAGGVAHDFNNLLSVILSYGQLLLEKSDLDASTRTRLNEIQRAGERAAALTRQLLAFSRQQVLEPTVLDLNVVVRDLHKILARVLGEDITLAMRLSDCAALTRADRGQLDQVLMNLAVNAREAMPRGGTLTFETARVTLDEAYAREHLGVEPGPYVLLAVTDTGTGMDRETQARIFEPFFTTKERGKGTGLGLATVLGIVQQSGGSIWLYSEPGAGTTFKIYLPEVAGALPAREPQAPAEPRATGHETILLVEDEPQIRAVAATILGDAGYRVLAAESPAEALTLAGQLNTPIDLLLTDVVMPGLDGRQVAEGVRQYRPTIRTLYMSGYTDDVILRHGVLESGVAFLQKPLTPQALTRKIRQLLDTPRDGR